MTRVAVGNGEERGALEIERNAMQMQPVTWASAPSPLCTLCCKSKRGSGLQYRFSHSQKLWTRQKCWTLGQQAAVNTSDHSTSFSARKSLQQQQHRDRKTPWRLHSVNSLQAPAPAGRGSTAIAAGNFMGLMGQILKDMSQTLPSGSSLTVDRLSYHPAGDFLSGDSGSCSTAYHSLLR